MPALSNIKKYVHAIMMPKDGLNRARNKEMPQTNALFREIQADVIELIKIRKRKKVMHASREVRRIRKKEYTPQRMSAPSRSRKKRRAAAEEKKRSLFLYGTLDEASSVKDSASSFFWSVFSALKMS